MPILNIKLKNITRFLTFIRQPQQKKIYGHFSSKKKLRPTIIIDNDKDVSLLSMLLHRLIFMFFFLSLSFSLTAYIRLLLVRGWISDLILQEQADNESEHKYLYIFFSTLKTYLSDCQKQTITDRDVHSLSFKTGYICV